MAQTIKLKRSATSGATPTTSQLELGEVAINTYDGKMYIKKNVGGTESIVEIGGGTGGSSTLSGLSDVTISSAAADQLLQYNGSEWVNVSIAEASAIMKEYQFTATAGQSTFSGSDDNSETLSYTAGAIQVFLNGIFLDSAVDYTATNGTSVVLSETVDANDYLQVVAFKKKIGDGNVSVDTFTGDNSTTAFTLSVDPGDENNTRVFIDGVYQSKDNYSVSGTTLTFSTAPPTSTAIEVEIGNRVVTLDTLSDLDLPDNVKLRLGTSQDADFYHDGTDTYLRNQTGQLLIRGNDTKLQSYLGETYATFANNGAATFYYDNSAKLATSNDGVTVTGDVEATGEIIGDLRGATLFKAQAGEALTKGEVVYISGVSGNTTVVSKADADDASKMPAFGLVAASASSGNPVDIYTAGILADIDTSSFSEGDELFVSTTAGALTSTAPTGESAALQKIGKVTRSASSGSIFIVGAGRSNAVPNLDDGDIFIGNASNQAVSASLNTKIESYLDGGTSTPTFAGLATTANMTFGDNDRAIFGAGSDLQIYHDGSNSYIGEFGTGSLRIRSNQIRLEAPDSQNMVIVTEDAGVQAFYNGTQRFQVTNTGIDVTGTVTADGLTVDGAATIGSSTAKTKFYSDSTYNGIYNGSSLTSDESIYMGGDTMFFYASGKKRLDINAGGDISFYEDTGTDAKLFWDASLESLGIGTTSLTPTDGANIELSSSTSSRLLLDNTGASGRKYAITSDTSGSLGFYDYDASAFRILVDSSGDVGIGTTSPSRPLDVLKSGSSGYIAKFRTSTNALNVYDAGTAANGIGIGTESGQSLRLFTNDTLASGITVDSSGNVGIGTTSPTAELDVRDSISIDTNGNTGFLRFNAYGTEVGRIRTPYNSATTSYDTLAINVETGHRVVFTENNNSKVVFSSGNVGIGTDSPTVTNGKGLHLANSAGPATRLHITDNTTGETSSDGTELVVSGGDFYIDQKEAKSIIAYTNGSERMRIDSSGNVDLYQGNNLTWRYAAGSTIRGSISIDSADNITFSNTSSNTERVRIDTSGNLLVGTTAATAYNNSSDVYGFNVYANGQIASSVNGAQAAYFNRQNSDGAIVDLRKDGASIGTIQTNSGRLDIQGASNTVRIQSGTSLMQVTNGTQITFETAGTERMRIADNGKVGVGTTVPNRSDFNIHGANRTLASTTSQVAITASDSIAADIGGSLHFGARYDTTTTDFAPTGYVAGRRENATVNNYAGYLQFGVTQGNAGTIEAMRITSTGNVGIGTTSPSQKLHVNGRVRSGDGLLSNAFQVYNTGTAGFLIELDISPSDYAHIHGTIKLQQFNVSSQQIIDFSATTINNGTVHTYAATADIDVTIKLFVYNSSWYIHVPSPSTYSDISAYIHLGAGYQGGSRGSNCIVGISSAGVPSSGVSGSVDIVAQKRVLANTAGNVGIGETSPNAKFHVKDTLNSTGVAGSATPIVIIQNERLNTGSGTAVLRFDTNEVSGTSQFQRATIGAGWDGSGNYKGFLAFATNDSSNTLQERMRIDSSGKVGIGGTVMDGQKLNIEGWTQSDTRTPANAWLIGRGTGGDGLAIGTSNTTPYATWFQSGYLANMGTSNHYALSFNPHGGNVGIGTSSPVSTLHVNGGGYFTQFVNPNGSGVGGLELGYDGTQSVLQSYHRGTSSYKAIHMNAAHVAFKIGGVEKARVHTDGSVGIGTSGPNAPLTVWTASNATSQSALRLNNPGGFSAAGTGAEIIFSQDRTTSEDLRMAAISSRQVSTGSSAHGALSFWTRASSSITEKVRLQHNGILSASAGIALGDGLNYTSANVLDDYEEGTWTPQVYYQNSTDQSNATNVVQDGRYVKIGSLVILSFRLDWTAPSVPANDNVGVKNLPFTGAHNHYNSSGTLISSGVSDVIFGPVLAGLTVVVLQDSANGGNYGDDIGNGTGRYIRGTITYFTNA